MAKLLDYLDSLDNIDSWPEGSLDAIRQAYALDVDEFNAAQAGIQSGADATIQSLNAELEAAKVALTQVQAHNYQLITQGGVAATPADENDGGVDESDADVPGEDEAAIPLDQMYREESN